MRPLPLLFSILSATTTGFCQDLKGTAAFLRPLDDAAFVNCDSVKNRALELAQQIPDSVYLMQLYPRDRGSRFFPFLSETNGRSVMAWLSKHDVRDSPYALFYYLKGDFALKCRDQMGNSVELVGTSNPSNKSVHPLNLDPKGEVSIWHFFLTAKNVAHVFVVTQVPLPNLNAEDLMMQIQKLLDARFLFLYIRHDPWFFGYVSDTVPFIFADPLTNRTDQEYRSSETMVCQTDRGGCAIELSAY